ncbi:Bifunctional protein FolC [compost metagenome]
MFGLLSDKDLPGVLQPLQGLLANWAVAPLPTPRSRPAGELQAALTNLHASVSVHENIVAALEWQCEQAAPGDEILVFGSFYSVAEALSWLAGHASGE